MVNKSVTSAEFVFNAFNIMVSSIAAPKLSITYAATADKYNKKIIKNFRTRLTLIRLKIKLMAQTSNTTIETKKKLFSEPSG